MTARCLSTSRALGRSCPQGRPKGKALFHPASEDGLVCLVGETDVLFINVDTPREKTTRRTFRASRPSKTLTRMMSWSECQRSLLSIVGTACRFNGYDERDGRGVHLRPVAQRSPRSAAVPPYEQCSSNE